MAMALQAETIRVLRFVPITGSESEVPQSSLQKVVFTADSMVLISATDGEATPMYKYDYRTILFTESTTPTDIETLNAERPEYQGEKFIKDGRLYILYEGRMYDVMGLKFEN